ncbi:MAG: DUF3467 domain-containing protein [Endomicrobium sp.]|jgi:hypothetical protein|nr:DUF3467 domain-containing protein [Endomicrobium sp.]
MEEKESSAIQMEIDETTAEGIYSNVALIRHSESEFIIDFMFFQPQGKKAKIRSRIILSPVHAKRILFAMKENITKYEAKFGQIKEPALQPQIHKQEYYN